MRAQATIVRSGLCKTSVRHAPRPSPSLFFYPGLRSRAVWESGDFAWAKPLAAQTGAIAEEAAAVRSEPSDYEPGEHQLHGGGDWAWHSYVQKGKRQPGFRERCPATAAALDELVGPDLFLGVPFGFAFFSTLGPGASIAPHFGPMNLRLRCHLPLVVPAGGDVGLRVGTDRVGYARGEAVVFDDAYEHEAWNGTDGERVVLLFDVWHPDLHADEREAVREMFEGALSGKAEQAAS